MVERLGGERGAKKCSIPLAIVLTKPGKRCQATSCLPREREPGSSSRQLDFKPKALIQSHFCLSPSIFFFCLSLHHSLPHPPVLSIPQSYPISALDSPLFPQASRSPIKCSSLGRNGADLTRSQSSLPSDETLNLTFASSLPSFSPPLQPKHSTCF